MEAFKRAVDYHPPSFTGQLDKIEPALNPHQATRRNSVTQHSKVVILKNHDDDDDSLVKMKKAQTNNRDNNNKGSTKTIRTQSFTCDCNYNNDNDDFMAPAGSFKTNHNSTAKNPVKAAFELGTQHFLFLIK